MTRTLVCMRVSQAAFDEIATRLREADYHHAFLRDGTISMDEIGIERDPALKMPPGIVEVDANDLSRDEFRRAMSLDLDLVPDDEGGGP